MSGLTDWERHRLADLERQLARDYPDLVARFSRPVRRQRTWVSSGIGWAMLVVGAVLLLSGCALKDSSVTVAGVLTLGSCWVPFLLARKRGRHPSP